VYSVIHPNVLCFQRKGDPNFDHGITQPMRDQIRKHFENALLNQSLFMTPNVLYTLQDHGISFQVRLAEALGKKPKSQLKIDGPKPNPFLPPDPKLLITSLDHHHLLFNKYCISRDHLLITTKNFESQFSRLYAKDFEAALHVLGHWEDDLLFFYNCGPNSGASVLHKHMQILPCSESGIPIDSILQKYASTSGVFSAVELPFLHACYRLGAETGESMASKLSALLQYCCQSLDLDVTSTEPPLDTEREPDSFLSYNLCFTKHWMFVIPRRIEQINGISINSVGYAGMILAKSSEDYDQIQRMGPLELLKQLAYPRSKL
jgi:ATP adenylyltransferase